MKPRALPYLGLVDVSGVQAFVRRSAELRTIAAASRVIEEKLPQRVRRAAGAARDVTVLITAGGNAALTADSKDELKKVLDSFKVTPGS